jgi:mono/diheme cytochrome c family protein
VREFIRKPHVVADYMYSNGVTMDELPVFQRDGMLRYASFVKHNRVTGDNKIEAGQDVFMIACSRCHTTNGLNGVVRKFEDLYGTDPLDEQVMVAFIQTMHNTRTFMPPFPGNESEAEAVAAYIRGLQRSGAWWLPGVQSGGAPKPDTKEATGE